MSHEAHLDLSINSQSRDYPEPRPFMIWSFGDNLAHVVEISCQESLFQTIFSRDVEAFCNRV